jgi:hypothetical protein
MMVMQLHLIGRELKPKIAGKREWDSYICLLLGLKVVDSFSTFFNDFIGD